MLRATMRSTFCLFAVGIGLLSSGLDASTTRAQTPSAARSNLRQGLKAYQSGRYAAAIPPLRKVTEAGTLNPRPYAALSLALLRTEKSQEAEQVVADGIDRLGSHPLLRLVRAEVLLQQGDFGKALSIYRALEPQATDTASAKGAGEAFLTPDLIRNRLGKVHQRIGTRAYAGGDTARAMRHLKVAREQVPGSAAVYSNLGVLHLKQGRAEKALEMAHAGLERADPQTKAFDRLLRVKASALRKTGDSKALAGVYEQLADRHPQDVQIQVAYAEALINAGSRKKSLQHFRTLLDRFPTERRVYEALINVYDRYKNTKGALKILRRMQENFPEDPEVLRRIAGRLEDLRRLSDARAAYDSVLTQTGDTLQVAEAVARTFEAQDSLPAAAVQYRIALRQPASPDALYRDLGRVLEKAGRWEAALVVYRRWEAHADVVPLVHQGRAFERLNRPDSAVAAYEAALSRGSDHPLPSARLSRLYSRRNRPEVAFERAVEALRRGLNGDVPLKKQPSGSPSPSIQGVPTAQKRRRRRTARRWQKSLTEAFALLTERYPRSRVMPVLEELLANHPNMGRLHLLVGRYHRRSGDLSQARHHLRRAAELMPRAPSVHLAMGRVATAQGDTTAALRSYRRAFDLDPSDSVASSALIRLHRKQGRLDTLIRRWRRRYETRPTDALRQSLLEALHKAGRYEEARQIGATEADSTS